MIKMDFEDIIGNLDDNWLNQISFDSEKLSYNDEGSETLGPEHRISEEVYQIIRSAVIMFIVRSIMNSADNPDPKYVIENIKKSISDYDNISSVIYSFSPDSKFRKYISDKILLEYNKIVQDCFEQGMERILTLKKIKETKSIFEKKSLEAYLKFTKIEEAALLNKHNQRVSLSKIRIV